MIFFSLATIVSTVDGAGVPIDRPPSIDDSSLSADLIGI